MSIRFDAAADRIVRTSDLLNYNAAYTIMGRIYIVSSVGSTAYQTWVGLNSNNSATKEDWVGTYGLELSLYVDSGAGFEFVSGTTVSIERWYHFALVRESTTVARLYLDGVEDAASTTVNVGSRDAVTRNEFGGAYSTDESRSDSRIAAIKAWTAALTVAEIKNEIPFILPRRVANIYGWWPGFPGDTERLRDYSQNARNWTAGGTLTNEAGPPVSWGIWTPPLPIFATAAGGTTYNQSVSGSITPTAVLLNQAQKVFTGNLTPSSVLLKQVQRALTGNVTPSSTLIKQSQKVLTGGITPTGALLNQAQKVLSGNVTPSGILAAAKAALISLTGSLTPSGALSNQAQKVLSGTIAPLGQLLKETQKVLNGSITPGGVLTGVKIALVSLVGSLTPTGTLSKETQKVLSGSLTPVGSILKQVGKLLSGALTPVGALIASLVSTNLESTFKGMFRGMFRRMK